MHEFEKEWAKYKYWVMSKSHHSYNEIRLLFKDHKNIDEELFYSIINSLKDKEESKKDEINAMEHIWGYFKKAANLDEKNKYLNYRDQYYLNQSDLNEVKQYLFNLSKKYNQSYLLKSYYFNK